MTVLIEASVLVGTFSGVATDKLRGQLIPLSVYRGKTQWLSAAAEGRPKVRSWPSAETERSPKQYTSLLSAPKPNFGRSLNLTVSNRFKTLLLVLLLRLLNAHISLPFSNLSTGLRSTNALNINFSLLPTKFLQPVNLAILTIWSLFNPLAVPAPHLLSPFLAHQPSPHWKPQIAHSDMHHPVSGINSLIHFVRLASHVSTHASWKCICSQ